MKQKDYTKDILRVFAELKKQYPTWEIGRHLDGAFGDYQTLWGISDKEFLHVLETYQAKLVIEDTDDDISKIIADGINLDAMMHEQSGDEDEDF